MKKIHLVLIPGAWGNQTRELVLWWFRHVIEYVVRIAPRDIEVKVVPVVYREGSERQHAEDALIVLKQLPRGARVIVVAYSMGGQVLRLAATKWIGRFELAIFAMASGPNGLSFGGFLRGMLAAPLAFLIGLITWRSMTLARRWEVRRLFGVPNAVADEIMAHSHPESWAACCELAMPGMRVKAPPLNQTAAGRLARIVRLVAKRDSLFRGEARNNTEGIKMIPLRGGHGAILDREETRRALALVPWTNEPAHARRE